MQQLQLRQHVLQQHWSSAADLAGDTAGQYCMPRTVLGV
jgi:hypothetical protein